MVTTYGSGTTTIPLAVDPSSATAEIVSYVPASVNGLGFQDYTRGGSLIYSGSIGTSNSANVEAPNLPDNMRGIMFDVNVLYDAVASTSGINLYTLYSTDNGYTYSTSTLVATVSGRKVESRIFVEYRVELITNLRFTITNIDATNPCKFISVNAKIYR